ncbi:MAG: hypothetical protein KGJ58_03170 [Patescibacteria group bacterium]|nr:hypothetical protein [Patescibacteria group bacterium]MDE1988745.1 hypothetical protein [Patescibacteria group bacterium]MDE2218425.1 hypothetical protein [Patescibacteria group bacterium]
MLLNAKVLLDQAWEIYKKSFWIFFGIIILPMLASTALTYSISASTSLLLLKSPSLNSLGLEMLILSGALTLAVIVIQVWGQTALLCAIKDRKENIGLKESYRRGWDKIISYFWVSFLSGIIISVGLFFFLVPGLIFLVWFGLASFVFISENKKGWSALMTSKNYARGNWRGVFWRFLFIGTIAYLFLHLFNTLEVFTPIPAIREIYFYFGYALMSPMATIYLFLIYENLKKIKNDDFVHQDYQKSERKK